jgi:hypothetical protein
MKLSESALERCYYDWSTPEQQNKLTDKQISKLNVLAEKCDVLWSATQNYRSETDNLLIKHFRSTLFKEFYGKTEIIFTYVYGDPSSYNRVDFKFITSGTKVNKSNYYNYVDSNGYKRDVFGEFKYEEKWGTESGKVTLELPNRQDDVDQCDITVELIQKVRRQFLIQKDELAKWTKEFCESRAEDNQQLQRNANNCADQFKQFENSIVEGINASSIPSQEEIFNDVMTGGFINLDVREGNYRRFDKGSISMDLTWEYTDQSLVGMRFLNQTSPAYSMIQTVSPWDLTNNDSTIKKIQKIVKKDGVEAVFTNKDKLFYPSQYKVKNDVITRFAKYMHDELRRMSEKDNLQRKEGR